MAHEQVEVVDVIEVEEDLPEHRLLKGDLLYRFSDGEILMVREVPEGVVPPVDLVGMHPAHPDAVKLNARHQAIERYRLRQFDA